MGSDGSSSHLWPGSALYGAYSRLSGDGGPKAQVGQRLLSRLYYVRDAGSHTRRVLSLWSTVLDTHAYTDGCRELQGAHPLVRRPGTYEFCHQGSARRCRTAPASRLISSPASTLTTTLAAQASC